VPVLGQADSWTATHGKHGAGPRGPGPFPPRTQEGPEHLGHLQPLHVAGLCPGDRTGRERSSVDHRPVPPNQFCRAHAAFGACHEREHLQLQITVLGSQKLLDFGIGKDRARSFVPLQAGGERDILHGVVLHELFKASTLEIARHDRADLSDRLPRETLIACVLQDLTNMVVSDSCQRQVSEHGVNVLPSIVLLVIRHHNSQGQSSLVQVRRVGLIRLGRGRFHLGLSDQLPSLEQGHHPRQLATRSRPVFRLQVDPTALFGPVGQRQPQASEKATRLGDQCTGASRRH
jgi:hypothetical protein